MSGALGHAAVAGLALGLLLGGCSKAAVANCPGVIYVSLASNGTISVNGTDVSLDGLADKLAHLRFSAHHIQYYRENSFEEPSAAQAARIRDVMLTIVAMQRPIGLSSKPDFSDSIDGDGNSHPMTACPGQA